MTLEQFFADNPKVALGFSGGVDSSYLLYAGKRYGAQITAYYVKTAFQPAFELRDAYRLAEELGLEITIIEKNILDNKQIASNPLNRCYYCKTAIFSTIRDCAHEDGIDLIIDGTNATDDVNDRPGMKALSELSVVSPLRECGITKEQVRHLSKEAGLFTWEKPSYACLATRIPADCAITEELLRRTERAEDILYCLGFRDFRVRILNDAARLQLPKEQMQEALERRLEIIKAIEPYFSVVLLDLEGR